MKIRTNYVSNSSSSSYIIAIGIVKKEFVEEVKTLVKDIYACKDSFQAEKDGREEICSFDGNFLCLDVKKGDYVFKLYDTVVAETNEDGEIISDVCEGDFNSKALALLCSDKFEKINSDMGQGRNG